MPSVFIEELIARHGAWKVLRDVAAAIVRRRKLRALPSVEILSDRLRRDVGLEPMPRDLRNWDFRF